MRLVVLAAAVLLLAAGAVSQFTPDLVRITIGSPSLSEEDRVIFHAHPSVPFVLTNFREGTLSLTNLDQHLLSWGVAITPLNVQRDSNTSRPLTSVSFKQVENPHRTKDDPLFSGAALDDEALEREEEELQRIRDAAAQRREQEQQQPQQADMDSETENVTPVLLSLPNSHSLSNQRGSEHLKRLRGRSISSRLSPEERLARQQQQEDAFPSLLEVATSARAQAQAEAEAQQKSLLAAAASTTLSAQAAAAAQQPTVSHSFLYTRDMVVSGRLAITNHIAAVGEVPQWSLYSHDDFQDSAEGWSHQDRSQCGTYGDVMLGGYCKFADVVAWRTFSALPPHKFLRLVARYHFIDNWKGEAGFAKVDNATVWINHHRQCDKIFSENCRGINVCGDDNYYDRLSTAIDVTIPHTNSTATLSFGSSLVGGRVNAACDASWAIDDVQLYLL